MAHGLEKAGKVSAFHAVFEGLAVGFLRSVAVGLLILIAIGCRFGPAVPVLPCQNDSNCLHAETICAGTECAPGCRLDNPECLPGSVCVPSVLAEGLGYCQPIVCTDDPLACPTGSFCWPPPESDNPLGSECMPPPPCSGLTADHNAPFCSPGECKDPGQICAVANVPGVPQPVCACVPTPQ